MLFANKKRESDVSSIGRTNESDASVLEEVKTVALVKIDDNNFLQRGTAVLCRHRAQEPLRHAAVTVGKNKLQNANKGKISPCSPVVFKFNWFIIYGNYIFFFFF